VFEVSSGELRHTLDAGAHAVTVAVLPTGEVVTGSQDRSLRVFRGAECITKIDEAHGDIIRSISVASTHLVSASNDQSLKMWSFDGIEMHCISGHQSFVYNVTHSQDNQMVLSSSDDCTVKLWSLENTQCKQSIMHAGTVWQAVTLPTGDFITACGDMIIRIWTCNPEKMAPAEERQTQKEMAEQHSLQAAAKGSSSTAMESAADISQMPSSIGKKNGEIRCFKDGGTVFAFSWNEGARIWDKIGEVVGQKEEKKNYTGDHVFPAGEYDFVFDVDMGPSLGMRQLPFNREQNPMEVAESFCSREQIHKSNVEQIRQFIIQNTGGGGGAPAAQAPAAQPPSKPAAPESSMFPIMTTVAFKDGKFEPLQKKILEFNEQVDASLKLDPTELLHLNEAITKLKSGILSKEFRDCEKEIIHVRLKQWPGDKLFPVLDLWRLFLVHPQSADFFKGTDRGTSFISDACQFLNGDINGPVGLCSARYLANLFLYQTNKYAIFDKKAYVLKNIEPALRSTNKNTRLATVTVLLNFAIVLHESSIPPKKWDGETAEEITRLALAFIAGAGADDAASLNTSFLPICSFCRVIPRMAATYAGHARRKGSLRSLRHSRQRLALLWCKRSRSLWHEP